MQGPDPARQDPSNGCARFLQTIRRHGPFFTPQRPIHIGRAPGRLDVMGGIADYSGSLVLEMPLEAACFVGAQVDDYPSITVRTSSLAGPDLEPEVSYDAEALVPRAGALEYAAAHRLLATDARRNWAGYSLGVLIAMHRELGYRPTHGLRLLIGSQVPVGAGLSSSAALEVASLHAMSAACGFQIEGREAALLCQRAENMVVGAPCGVMDQMTVECGRKDALYALLCQPAEPHPPVPVPEQAAFWGINTGVRHNVGGDAYRAARTGAFMGYRIIADIGRMSAEPIGPGRVAVRDTRWGGHLANVSVQEWQERFRSRVPASLDGASFVAAYGGTTDHVTSVDPDRTYAVRAPTAHPIYEYDRASRFRSMLLSPLQRHGDFVLLGDLMYESHAGYSACGLGCAEADRIVELVRQYGPESGLYGARITGGGCGGTVAILGRRNAGAVVRAVAEEYAKETRRPASVLTGSSDGAQHFGSATFRLD